MTSTLYMTSASGFQMAVASPATWWNRADWLLLAAAHAVKRALIHKDFAAEIEELYR